MAIEAFRLQGVVDVDTKPAESGIGRFSSGLGNLIGGAAKAATVALAGIGVAAGAASIVGIRAASDLAENMNKVNVVFGDSSGAIRDFAANAAQSFGISESAALGATGTFGNLLVSMGLGAPAAADMSKGIVGLAADLGSFNNLGTEEVLEKIRAGLVGETEPLRSLGVNLTAAAIEAKAMALGLGDATGELSPAAKAQAAYALILEQTTTAQGDFARTRSGMANSLKIIRASFSDLSAEIGSRLLPAVAPLIAAFAARMPAAIDATMRIVDRVAGALRGPLTTAFTLARDSLLTLAQALSGNWTDDSAIHPLHRAIGLIGTVIREQVIPAVIGLAGWFTGTALPAIQSFATLAAGFVIGTLIPAFQQIAAAVIPRLQELSTWFLTVGLPAIQAFATQAQAFITGVLIPAFTGFTESVIPPLQTFAGFIQDNLKAVMIGLGVALTTIVIPAFVLWAVSAATAAAATLIALAPVVLAVVGITAAVALLYTAWTQNWGDIQGKTAAVWAVVGPILQQIGERLSVFAALILPELILAWDNVSAKVSAAVTFLWGSVIQPTFAAISGFLSSHSAEIQAILETAWNAISGTINNVLSVISNTIQFWLNIFQGDWSGAWENVKAIAAALWDQIKLVIDTALQLIVNLFPIALDLIQSALSLAWEGIRAGASLAWDAIKAVIALAWDKITDAVSAGIGRVVEFVGTLPGRAVAALGDLGSLLYQQGVDLVQGLLDGIGSMLGALRDKISELGDLLTIDVPGFSPPYDAGFKQARSFMGGLADGLTSGSKLFNHILSDISDGFAGAYFDAAVTSGPVITSGPGHQTLSFRRKTLSAYGEQKNRAIAAMAVAPPPPPPTRSTISDSNWEQGADGVWHPTLAYRTDDIQQAIVAGMVEFARQGGVTINLDGRKLAESITRHQAADYRLVNQLVGG